MRIVGTFRLFFSVGDVDLLFGDTLGGLTCHCCHRSKGVDHDTHVSLFMFFSHSLSTRFGEVSFFIDLRLWVLNPWSDMWQCSTNKYRRQKTKKRRRVFQATLNTLLRQLHFPPTTFTVFLLLFLLLPIIANLVGFGHFDNCKDIARMTNFFLLYLGGSFVCECLHHHE